MTVDRSLVLVLAAVTAVAGVALYTAGGSAGAGNMVAQADPAVPATPNDAAHPAVVELFESQGCSDCPPANANLNAIADRPGILALNFAVTYWDQLGWKDTFAKPAFTARQWDYAHAAGRGQVATPQVIVNGRGTVVGSNAPVLAAAIRANARGPGGPVITTTSGKVVIGAAPAIGAATVWLVRYDPRTIAVPISAGENNGRTLPHRNIVRSIDALGQWKGGVVSFPLPAAFDPHYRAAVLVQQGKGGKIVAASKI